MGHHKPLLFASVGYNIIIPVQTIPRYNKGRVGLRVLPPLIRIYNEMTVKLTVNDRVILVLRLAYALVSLVQAERRTAPSSAFFSLFCHLSFHF